MTDQQISNQHISPAVKHRTRPRMMIAVCSLIALTAVILFIDLYVASFGRGIIYDSTDAIPAKRAALVLGTVKYVSDGQENIFYHARLNTAAELFRHGKVKAILISGDNSRHGYNEPVDMLTGLLERGIPREYITLDYAGFRTLDSIVRAREIFDMDDYIIVSQRFHDERALYIARKKGHKAIAIAAKDAPGIYHFKVRAREVIARLRAFIDIQILGTQPRFLGRKETVKYKESEIF